MTSTGMPRPQSRTVTELSGWMHHLDRVVVARQRLVDGVVDDLVDEVVEAARAGRADVHPGPQPDRLEALEDRDVLCGVGRFVMLIKKSPAKRGFCGPEQCIRIAGRIGLERLSRGSPRPLWRPLAQLVVVDREPPAEPPRATSSGVGGTVARAALARRLAGRLRQRPGREPERGRRRRRRAASRRRSSDLVGRAAELERPDDESAASRAACRRGRSAPARRCGRSRRRPPPASAATIAAARRLPAGRAGELAARPAAEPLHQRGTDAARGRPRASCAGSSGSASAPVAVTIAWPTPADPLARARAGGRRRAPRARRRAAGAAATPRRSASSSASARRSASTARRCSPCEPKVRRSRSPREHAIVVEMRAEAGRRRARGRVRAAPRARLRVGGSPSYPSAAPARPSSSARAANAGPSSSITSRRAATSSRAELGHLLRPRRQRVARAESPAATRRSAAFRWPSAAAYSSGSGARPAGAGAERRGRSRRGARPGRP